MQATSWEFKQRAVIFGLIISVGFFLYNLDPENTTDAVTTALAYRYGIPADPAKRTLLAAAALVVAVAALIRTWASAYLNAQVVYAANIKTAALVADGPYRYVRNPLYFANVLLVLGMGAMMCRAGFFVAAILMVIFCYRLILREESELQSAQAGEYTAFFRSVPRLWPALRPRLAASGRAANWKDGFKAESWYWGFALAILAFAVTLQIKWFFIVTAASLALFWGLSSILQRQSKTGV